MRIAQVTQSYPPMISGAAVVVARLAAGLAARDHQVLVLTAQVDRPEASAPVSGLHVQRLPAWPNPFRVGQRFVPWPGQALTRALAEFRPDAVHVHEPGLLGQASLRWGRARGVRTLYTLHQLPWFLSASLPPALKWLGRWLEQPAWAALGRVLASADAVIAPSNPAAEQVAARGLARPQVISNGTPLERFRPRAHTPQGRAAGCAAFGLDPTLPIVLHVGRLDRDKDVEHVILAAARVLRVQTGQLVIAGDGTERTRLARLAASVCGASTPVHFLGYVRDDLPELYGLAMVFVTASRIEIQSTVVLEAMASGVPVIAPDLPAMRDLVEPGVTGWLAPTSGPDDLAFALTAALNGPTESLRRGRAARRRAEAHSLAASVEAHLRLYRAQA
jgi:glycosyltransferase involved in cell wall biosynthesis